MNKTNGKKRELNTEEKDNFFSGFLEGLFGVLILISAIIVAYLVLGEIFHYPTKAYLILFPIGVFVVIFIITWYKRLFKKKCKEVEKK